MRAVQVQDRPRKAPRVDRNVSIKVDLFRTDAALPSPLHGWRPVPSATGGAASNCGAPPGDSAARSAPGGAASRCGAPPGDSAARRPVPTVGDAHTGASANGPVTSRRGVGRGGGQNY